MTENFWCPLPCLNKRISEICLRFFYRYLQYCQDSIRQNCKIKKYNDLWLSIKIELFLQNLPYCSLHLILRKYITLLSCHLLNMPSIKKKRKKKSWKYLFAFQLYCNLFHYLLFIPLKMLLLLKILQETFQLQVCAWSVCISVEKKQFINNEHYFQS